MEAYKQIEKRLQEIAAIRTENINKINDMIGKWTEERDEALKRLEATKNDPEKLKDRALAKVAADEANAKIRELQQLLSTYEKKPIVGTPEETDELFTALKREMLTDLISKADRALELQQELFDISKQIKEMEIRNSSLQYRWIQDACAWLDENRWRYVCVAPPIFNKCSGWDARIAFVTGAPIMDNRSQEIRTEIVRMMDELNAM